MLPQELFSNKNAKFLDPATKSGVFLREIAKRLLEGLKDQIPDLKERIDHIFHYQIYGIAITEITSLLSRRSIYCSKYANSKYSISLFNNVHGNIRFKDIKHTWKKNKCAYCGANRTELGSDSRLESHAYEFIHNPVLEEIGKMKFDVIIGNPPYQLNDGGGEGASAVPIYNLFIEQSIKLNPRHLLMIIPARWYSGGKGLDDFRRIMLNNTKISELHDFPETNMCFPGQNIRGGVCYFLLDREHKGDTKVVNYRTNNIPSTLIRPMLFSKYDVFIRFNEAIEIIKKVQIFKEDTFDLWVYSRNVFDIPSNFSDFMTEKTDKYDLLMYRSRRGKSSEKEVFINRKLVIKNTDLINRYKVIVSKASPGGDEYPHAVFSNPIVSKKDSVFTETYLLIRECKEEITANNIALYMKSRFFRFLVAMLKTTQNISKSCFALVPLQDFSIEWTDEMLFNKYNISKEEISFIDTIVRPSSIFETDTEDGD
jgi:site-specific DNA-methyltransferase (adenine-specific)